jgi:hypothetical protein
MPITQKVWAEMYRQALGGDGQNAAVGGGGISSQHQALATGAQ